MLRRPDMIYNLTNLPIVLYMTGIANVNGTEPIMGKKKNGIHVGTNTWCMVLY